MTCPIQLRPVLAFFGVVSAVWFSPACSSGGDGSITVTWTINLVSDAAYCGQYGVSDVAVIVNNAAGSLYGSSTPKCTALSTYFPDVPVGNYTLAAQMLLDIPGDPIGTTDGAVAVSITKDNTFTQNFDFSAPFVTTSSSYGALTVNWTIASFSGHF